MEKYPSIPVVEFLRDFKAKSDEQQRFFDANKSAFDDALNEDPQARITVRAAAMFTEG